MAAGEFNLENDGAVRHRRAALSLVAQLLAIADGLEADRAGLRLFGIPALSTLLGDGSVLHGLASSVLGDGTHPVRAILFDKAAANNWALGWHQDRTIAVRERIDLPGFGRWTVKPGVQHVEPPFGIISLLLTMRVHLDDVDDDNAPLLIAPGSNHDGRIAEGSYGNVVARCGTAACYAEVGDVWLHHTSILHASARSVAVGRRRRVLQVDYTASALPGGLEWLGV